MSDYSRIKFVFLDRGADMELNENIAWCPKCKVEYNAWAKTCSDCLVDLVSELPVHLHEDGPSLKNNLDPLELLVSLADESEAKTIISLLDMHNIPVTRAQIEDDTNFGIGLYVSESLVVKALAILQREDDKKGEIISEIETMQSERDGYTGFQLFKENFADEDMIDSTVAPGRNFLKITSVLYIIFSGSAFIRLFALPNLSLLSVRTLLSSYNMFMGIIGIKYCKSIDKANLLRVLAITDLLLRTFFLIHSIVLLQMQIAIVIFAFVLSVFDFALPILYLVGA